MPVVFLLLFGKGLLAISITFSLRSVGTEIKKG